SRQQLVERGNTVGGCSVISVSKAAFNQCGGFPITRGAQDWALLLAISQVAEIRCTGEATVRYRSPVLSNYSSMTRDHRKQILAISRISSAFSDEERQLSASLRRSLYVRLLALAGRTRMARKIAFGGIWGAKRNEFGSYKNILLSLFP